MWTIVATEENQNKHFDTHSYVCLSSDTKPTEGIKNGCFCLEMDTGTFFAFDEANTEWIEIGA